MTAVYTPCFVHVYRLASNGRLRAIGGPNREWKGRPAALVRSYQMWEDGRLTEIEARCADRKAS